MRTHILDTQIRRSCAKQVTTRKIHSHVTGEPQVALDASNRADFYLRISPYTKHIQIPIPYCLAPNVVEKKPVIVGET